MFYFSNTTDFNRVNRRQVGNGCDFKHEIVEIRGNNCFIPTKGYWFIKCVNFLTGEDYKQQYLHFIRIEKRRTNIMTIAGIQPFCRANNINLGYYDRVSVFHRAVRGRNKAIYLHNIHLCLRWKSPSVSFKQAMQELGRHFETFDNYII